MELNASFRRERTQLSHLNFQLEKLWNEEQIKPPSSKKTETIKIRAKIHKIENSRQVIKLWSLKWSRKLIKPLARSINKKRSHLLSTSGIKEHPFYRYWKDNKGL